MQTDRREKQCDKELKLLKKLSTKVFSFIQLQNRSHKYLLFLLRKKFTLLLVIRFARFAASFTIKSLCNSYKLVAIQFFYLSIWIFTKKRVFCVVGLSNLKIFNKKKIKNRAKECIFRVSGGTNFENFSSQHQPWWCFNGFDVCTCLPKKLWICRCQS